MTADDLYSPQQVFSSQSIRCVDTTTPGLPCAPELPAPGGSDNPKRHPLLQRDPPSQPLPPSPHPSVRHRPVRNAPEMRRGKLERAVRTGPGRQACWGQRCPEGTDPYPGSEGLDWYSPVQQCKRGYLQGWLRACFEPAHRAIIRPGLSLAGGVRSTSTEGQKHPAA